MWRQKYVFFPIISDNIWKYPIKVRISRYIWVKCDSQSCWSVIQSLFVLRFNLNLQRHHQLQNPSIHIPFVVCQQVLYSKKSNCRCTQIGGIGYISQQLGECKWLKACWFSSWSEPARSSSIEAAWQMYSRQGHRRHHPPFENSSSWLSAKHHNTLLCKQKSQRIKSLKVWPCVHFRVVLGILLVNVYC